MTYPKTIAEARATIHKTVDAIVLDVYNHAKGDTNMPTVDILANASKLDKALNDYEHIVNNQAVEYESVFCAALSGFCANGNVTERVDHAEEVAELVMKSRK